MDRNTVIATVLIAIIMFVWLFLLAPPAEPPPVTPEGPDTTEQAQPAPEPEPPEPELTLRDEVAPEPVTDSTLVGAQQGEARTITVETDLYTATFSTKGGTLTSFLLKEYDRFDQETPVQLVDTSAAGAVSMVFTTPANHVVDTRSFYFEPSRSSDRIDASAQPAELTFTARVGEGLLRKTYTFTPETYEVGLQVEQENAASFMTDEGYEMVWSGAVPFSEKPSDMEGEIQQHGAFARSGGEVEGISLASETYDEKTLRGEVSWTAVKNKYFTAVVIPGRTPSGAELIGERTGSPEEGTVEEFFTTSLMMPTAPSDGDTYRLYLGPLEFYRITDYDLGLFGMVDYGWDAFEWMTRPLAKFIFIPAFTFLSTFIANYGLVIIILAIIIKMLLYPLTRSSYRSMARMRELQPKLQAIKEKHGDDPQKQQQAMMKVYKETGVNPLGGCLPMFLQYPIIIALWQFLQQSIEIRQQGFLWANDLSAPDVILNLPFTIPFYGDFVAGFTILMGLSMIVQMRIQQGSGASTNPQAKMFMYIMPVFIFVIFNRFPSGLSLYYLMYNIVSAVQQKFINKSIESEKEEDDNDSGKKRRSRKKASGSNGRGNGQSKKGFFERLREKAEEAQRQR